MNHRTAASGPGAKYYIGIGAGVGTTRMFALNQIDQGTCILTERPLISLEIGLRSTYITDTFFVQRPKIANGVEALQKDYHKADDFTKNELMRLHHGLTPRLTGEDDDARANRLIPSIVQLNFFEVHEIRDGQEYCTLKIYRELSRINHSCRPNAVVDWNPSGSAATLYAIRPIQRNGEILIDYLSNTDDCLRGKGDRGEELKEAYGFDCACAACSIVGNADGIARTAAKRMLERVDSPQTGNETAQQYLNRRIQDANLYVTALRNLHLFDWKLGHAYEKLADAHHERYVLCDLGAANSRCRACRDNRSSKDHLDQAIDAMDRACKVLLRCVGKDHPSFLEYDTKYWTFKQKQSRYSP